MARERKAAAVDDTTRQEGSRWIGHRPTGEQVAAWFGGLHLHEDMVHEHYVSGVTLITQTETIKVLRDGLDGGAPQIVEEERLVHVPYAKVETRIAYFWDLCRENSWLGVIEPVPVPRVEGAGLDNRNLPVGFFRMPIGTLAGTFTHFVCCTMKVSAYVPDVRAGGRGRPVFEAPPAVKQIATLGRGGNPDPYALMKAETGAVGRALGMAGMLVLPGSGVATAEDMQEVLAGEGRAATGQREPVLPGGYGEEVPPATQADLIHAYIMRLDSDAPGALESIEEWARERKPPIDMQDLKPTQQRAVLAKLEQAVAELDARSTPAPEAT